jgi:hypothetical protein
MLADAAAVILFIISIPLALAGIAAGAISALGALCFVFLAIGWVIRAIIWAIKWLWRNAWFDSDAQVSRSIKFAEAQRKRPLS